MMKVKMWHKPFNGGWIWFQKNNLKRCSAGWIKEDHTLWWAIFGFSGFFTLQTWPWQKNPAKAAARMESR